MVYLQRSSNAYFVIANHKTFVLSDFLCCDQTVLCGKRALWAPPPPPPPHLTRVFSSFPRHGCFSRESAYFDRSTSSWQIKLCCRSIDQTVLCAIDVVDIASIDGSQRSWRERKRGARSWRKRWKRRGRETIQMMPEKERWKL